MAEEISSADESAETNPTALTEPELSAEDKTELTAEAATDETTDHNADEKPEDSVADKGKDGAPEEYSDFTLPEGVNLDAAAVAEAIPLLKEMGATQEQAQKLAQSKAWTDQLGEWKDARETDAEFGKSKYDESIAIARKGMREFGEPALFAALEETGMGNHPELIRAFYRVGKAIGEDGFNFGSSNTEGGQSLAEKLFPNQGKAA